MAEKTRVLHDDTRLPHVRMALSRKRAMAFFNERILPAVLPGREVIDLSQQRVRYKPGKECRVHYRLKIAPEGEEKPLHQIVTITFRNGRALEEIAARATGVNGAMRGKTLFVPDYACLVEFFPADYRLSGLARAVDADAMAEQLRSGGGELATASVARVRLVRYRPGFTCVLRYTLEPEGGGKQFEVMGKVYPGIEEAAEMRRKLTSLSEQAAPEGLAIPRPLDLPQEDNLVLMEKVPGANMDKLLLATASEEEAAPLVDLAAQSLASFHELQLEARLARTLESEFRRLGRRLGRIQRIAPDLAAKASALTGALDESKLVARPEELRLIHGDFKPNQFLVEDGRAALVDLDRAGIGDPAVDVGNFMAVLRKKSVVNKQPHFVPLEERFLERYLALRPDEASARRARLFQGIALVRVVLAKFERSPRSYARQGPNWPWLAVLDEAERCLART